MSILVRNVSKRFGDFTALDDVSLEVEGGSLTALLGPSGSGKSTLLRIIAGLEVPDTGEILISGADATDLKPQKRNVGFVFQHYAAFKHMTVRDNIGFGLSVRKRPKAEIRDRVDELLRLVQLEAFGHRYPAQLSGGQRQRMALARALAPKPEVLLLDEPFGALDARVRAELREWLRRLHEEVHVTTIFVTHDQADSSSASRNSRAADLPNTFRPVNKQVPEFKSKFRAADDLLDQRPDLPQLAAADKKCSTEHTSCERREGDRAPL